MKLTIGKPDYPFSAVIKSAVIRGRRPGKNIPLILMPYNEMKQRHEKLRYLRGMPTCVSFDPEKRKVWLHPSPDGEYELDIEAADVPAPERKQRQDIDAI